VQKNPVAVAAGIDCDALAEIVGLVLTDTGALVIEETSAGKVFEASRANLGQDSGNEASIADSDAVDTFGFDDFEIAHDGWEVPMGCALVSRKILFQPGHRERA
jgi:hypothetical protein